jgi:diguanylate cyclase (GGDEF)-like protein
MRINVSAQRRQIRELAFRDRLTGLPNRLQFRDDVQQAIAGGGPGGSRGVVLMLDLDRFKHVNDVLGYAFGDRLLEQVAQRLQQVVRDGDVVARLGGDEFALLMRDADIALASTVAQRISAAFEVPLTIDDHTVDLSAGLGLAAWPDHAQDADALLSRAEVAMYAAKRRTAGAQVYDPAVDSASALNLSLLSELRRAVENHELRLFLQPKIAINTGAVCGAEALVRWQHPERGLVPPMAFIPFAEQTGFIRQLTLWMFEQAAAEQVQLAVLGVRTVSVNLSTRDLMDQDLPDKLETILRRHRALAEGFCLEITESAIMDDPQRAETTLNRLAERGYKLSIDDFGTGYSSLAYLKRLPVDELKIDKSFVMAMEKDAGDAMIVRSTIDLAHNLGLTVVAEGIENEAVLTLLHELKCDEGQGYHMSKPLPVDKFCDWVARWQARAPAPAGLPAELRLGAPLLH